MLLYLLGFRSTFRFVWLSCGIVSHVHRRICPQGLPFEAIKTPLDETPQICFCRERRVERILPVKK
jgi:hypothetical protein